MNSDFTPRNFNTPRRGNPGSYARLPYLFNGDAPSGVASAIFMATAPVAAFLRALEAARFSFFAAAFSSSAFCWAFVGAGESGLAFSKGAGAAGLGLVHLVARCKNKQSAF